jgi:hypothetical protein
VAAIYAEVGASPLWEQLARRVGAEGLVRAGPRLLRGTVAASYPDFFVLQAPAGGQHLVRFEAVSLALAPGRGQRRFHLALALRELARRREPVRVELTDGSNAEGTIEAVGSDYLELAEHQLGEARRETAVRGRRFAAFAAIALVTLPPERR